MAAPYVMHRYVQVSAHFETANHRMQCSQHMLPLRLCSCTWTTKLPRAISAIEYQKMLLLWGEKKKSKLLSYRQHKTQNTASYVMEWWSQLVWDSCQSKEFTENFSVVYTKFQTSSNLFSYLKDTLKEKPFSSNKTKL